MNKEQIGLVLYKISNDVCVCRSMDLVLGFIHSDIWQDRLKEMYKYDPCNPDIKRAYYLGAGTIDLKRKNINLRATAFLLMLAYHGVEL